MATLERNNGQESYPTENGDTLPEEKNLSIDYSEDLWLANEDSSGPYAQQPNKVVSIDPASVQNSQLETLNHYPQSVEAVQAAEGLVNSEPTDNHVQQWDDRMPVDSVSESSHLATLEPAANYMNGDAHDQNGYSSDGHDKDFVQMVPAGSFVENVPVNTEGQDKTFTSLMPAAGMEVNGDDQQGFTTMLAADHQQMVYYGSGEQLQEDSQAPVMNDENLSYDPQEGMAREEDQSNIQYDQSGQMVEEDDVQMTHENKDVMYAPVENLAQENQVAVSGDFTVMNPALMATSSTGAEVQTYVNSASAGAQYHNISTLPFVQNGTYAAQPNYTAAYDGGATIITNSDGLPSAEYGEGSSLGYGGEEIKTEVDSGVIEDDEDDDEDGMSGGEGDGMEMSEFMCPMCAEPFPDQPTLDEHVANHPPEKEFVCATCGKGFATRRYLKYHRKNHCKRAGSYEGRDFDENDPNGEIRRFMCNVCSRPFRVLKCMKVHKKKKHGIMKEFTCQSCAVTFETSQELFSHPCKKETPLHAPLPVQTVETVAVQAIQATPLPPFPLPSPRRKKKLKNAKPCCDICGKTFADRISVDIHRVKHIEEELYPCDMCENCEEGSENHHLAVYFRIKFFTDDNQHILEDQKAAVASADPTRIDESNIKVEIHNPGTPMAGSSTPLSAPATPVYYPAGQGPSTPHSINVLNQSETPVEMIDGHLVDQYGQYVDGTQVVNNYVLKQYGDEGAGMSTDQTMLVSQQQGQAMMHSQGQQTPIFLGEGGSAENEEDERRKKLMILQQQRPKIHCCDICNKSFTDSAKLELHYKSNHLEDRPFQCDVCDKSFFTKWKLQRHMLSHLEQKPHSCPMCSKSFVERGKLEAHYRTHLGTKPFKCEHCHKAFTVKSQLTIHVRRIHSTDQPFACFECGKAFLWKSGLDKHMRKHTREKPYSCHCGQRYSNKSNLILHMSKVHNETHVDAQTGH